MNRETTQHHPPLSGGEGSPWLNLVFALAAMLLYLLLHPYLGITHDARLYSLQALNHLQPVLYGNDVFLRYGSQDDYTLFTPLYALAISWLGVESAAALLTFLSQVTFLTAAFLLARSLQPTRVALVALCLLLALPDHYGSARIFAFLEEFITPRQLAEAFVLFSITAWLRHSRLLASLFATCAMLLHPIMGSAGAALLVSISALPHWRKVLPLVLALLVLAILIAANDLLPEQWLLDGEWLEIVLARAEYLSLFHWSSDDWGRVAVVVSTLAIGAQTLGADLRRLALAALASTFALMPLTLIGGDLLHISLVVQAQPWRILWLSTVTAIILLPALAIECWHQGKLRRCGLLLLIASWLLPAENVALLIAPLATAAVFAPDSRIYEKHLHLLLLGSWTALGLVLLAAAGASALSVRAGTYGITVSPTLDLVRTASTGGTVALLALLALTHTATGARTRLQIGLSILLASLVVAVAIPTASTWTAKRYGEELKAAFSDWRKRIPPGSDVMWAADPATGADGAVSAWLLLERPSYVSRIQATTSLFSRRAAFEIRDRTQSVIGLLPDIQSLQPRKTKVELALPLMLARVCHSSSARYIVTRADFVDATPIPASPRIRPPFRNLKLYTCP
jgi:hypothetical protein